MERKGKKKEKLRKKESLGDIKKDRGRERERERQREGEREKERERKGG